MLEELNCLLELIQGGIESGLVGGPDFEAEYRGVDRPDPEEREAVAKAANRCSGSGRASRLEKMIPAQMRGLANP